MNRHVWKMASLVVLLMLGGASTSPAGYDDLTPYWKPTPPPPVSPLIAPAVSGTWSTSDPIETRRLFRDGNPSVFTSPKPFPGTSLEQARYATFGGATLVNPFSTPTALFVSLSDPNNVTFVSAYLGAFNPANLSQNYLGDAGFSGDGTSFSVLVPVGGSVTLVANTIGGTSLALGSTYTITYFFASPTAVPEPSSVILVGTGLVGLVGYQVRRRRRAVA